MFDPSRENGANNTASATLIGLVMHTVKHYILAAS